MNIRSPWFNVSGPSDNQLCPPWAAAAAAVNPRTYLTSKKPCLDEGRKYNSFRVTQAVQLCVLTAAGFGREAASDVNIHTVKALMREDTFNFDFHSSEVIKPNTETSLQTTGLNLELFLYVTF